MPIFPQMESSGTKHARATKTPRIVHLIMDTPPDLITEMKNALHYLKTNPDMRRQHPLTERTYAHLDYLLDAKRPMDPRICLFFFAVIVAYEPSIRHSFVDVVDRTDIVPLDPRSMAALCVRLTQIFAGVMDFKYSNLDLVVGQIRLACTETYRESL